MPAFRDIRQAKQYRSCEREYRSCSCNGAQLIVLPELWNCPYPHDSFPNYVEAIDAGGEASPSTAMLAYVSRTKKVTIVAGSIPERNGGNLYNTCCVFSNGDLLAKFRKFGEILATTEHEEATIIADIDYSQLDTRRQNMPLESQRRGDLYHLTDATRAR